MNRFYVCFFLLRAGLKILITPQFRLTYDYVSKGKTSTGVLNAYQQWLATGHTLTEKAAPGGGGGDVNTPPPAPTYQSTFDAVRGAGLPKALDSCLNHLFTHVDFNTGTVGVATMKGICQEQGFYVGSNPGSYSASKTRHPPAFSTIGDLTGLPRCHVAPPPFYPPSRGLRLPI